MKRLLLAGLPVLSFLTAFSINITPERAATRAAELLHSDVARIESSALNIRLKKGDRQPAFYIFNSKEKPGFVILSSDDRMPEVLGYSQDSSFDLTSEIPPQMEWYLQALTEGHSALQEIEDAQFYQAEKKSPILLKTANWGQLDPFNLACPGRYYAGCGATAMAIMMHYYQYPEKGNGNFAYTWNQSRLFCDFEQIIPWGLMLDDYSDGKATSEQKNAVAQLIKYCGYMLEMNYSPVESMSYASNYPRLAKFMGYSDLCEYIDKDRFGISDKGWTELLDSHLEAGHPVPYRGAQYNDSGGHIFLIDGRDENGLYHINWGWDGQLNGYFNLSALTPNGHQYSFRQGMVINAVPDPEANFKFTPMTTTAENESSGLKINRERIVSNDKFYACISGFKNRGTEMMWGEAALALMDAEGNIKDVSTPDNFSLQPSYYYTTFSFPEASFGMDAEPGDRVQFVYRNNDSEEWLPVQTGYNTVSSVSAYDHHPDYASLTWSCDPRIRIESYNNQYSDKALKNNRYDFYVSTTDPEVTDIRILLNGKFYKQIKEGWINIPSITLDKYAIGVWGFPELAGADELEAESKGTPVTVYSVEGLRIGEYPDMEQALQALELLPRSVYIVANGENHKKIIGGSR